MTFDCYLTTSKNSNIFKRKKNEKNPEKNTLTRAQNNKLKYGPIVKFLIDLVDLDGAVDFAYKPVTCSETDRPTEEENINRHYK